VLPRGIEARRGYDVLSKDFPDLVATRMDIAITFPTAPALTEERISALYDFSRRLAKIPHVIKVESLVDRNGMGDDPDDEEPSKEDYQDILLHPPETYATLIEEAKKVSVSGKVMLLHAVTDRSPESEDARAIVRAIRADRRVGDGTLVVGGQTANDLDSTGFIVSRAPRAVGFIVLVSLVVLFLLLRSVVLPLKAIAMNFVSIAGSFGALVFIYQDGHFWIHDPRPLEPTLPVLLFCTLFGLSMDYEVLMLSRMKEAYEKSRDNEQAVAEGLEKTAGLITSAAAIMVTVFGAFSLAQVVMIQAVGLGMAMAVALDATLVRVLLVPATMRLFGDFNWWAPGNRR
jgi:RND superfamily putative drug exporter